MKINRLEIKGYKSIEHLVIEDLSYLNVFAGANGSGKSNIVDAIAFLGANIQKGAELAIKEFGGFNQIHCFKVRKERRTTISYSINILFGEDLYEYELIIKDIDTTPKYSKEQLSVNNEIVIKRDSKDDYVMIGQDKHTLEFFPDNLSALMFSSKHSLLHMLLSNIKVYRIDPFNAKKPSTQIAEISELDSNATNLANILTSREQNGDFRNEVLDWLSLIVPGMEKIHTDKRHIDGSTFLMFKEEGTKASFPAHLVSDGTIYVLSILTAVLDRTTRLGITIIEEPERGIHPQAISALVNFMREKSELNHPIILTTHSESIVRSIDIKELNFISKIDGKTQIFPAKVSGVDKNEIPLDTAWLTNLFDRGLAW